VAGGRSLLIGSGLRLRAGVFLVCHGLHAAAEEGGGEGALGELRVVAFF